MVNCIFHKFNFVGIGLLAQVFATSCSQCSNGKAVEKIMCKYARAYCYK